MIIRQSNFITIKPIILRLNFVRVKKIDTCKQRNSVWGCNGWVWLDTCYSTIKLFQSAMNRWRKKLWISFVSSAAPSPFGNPPYLSTIPIKNSKFKHDNQSQSYLPQLLLTISSFNNLQPYNYPPNPNPNPKPPKITLPNHHPLQLFPQFQYPC